MESPRCLSVISSLTHPVRRTSTPRRRSSLEAGRAGSHIFFRRTGMSFSRGNIWRGKAIFRLLPPQFGKGINFIPLLSHAAHLPLDALCRRMMKMTGTMQVFIDRQLRIVLAVWKVAALSAAYSQDPTGDFRFRSLKSPALISALFHPIKHALYPRQYLDVVFPGRFARNPSEPSAPRCRFRFSAGSRITFQPGHGLLRDARVAPRERRRRRRVPAGSTTRR